MRHINIPIFIPHMGCPNLCVFCNQRTISGTCFFEEESVSKTIEEVLSTAADAECEIAFFGGSFTGIDRMLMIRLLDTAQKYVDSGDVIGIRMSTRPDYIDSEIIDILKKYTVTQVELGLQSMSDKVLKAAKRGHTADCAERAVTLLRENGFEVVGQMMIGLPGSDIKTETETALKICSMGCVSSRIYPTIVFKDTELWQMYMCGEYEPLSVEDAVERSAAALDIFERRGVRCLRIGLCESENLHSDNTYAAGPNHSAVGELVMSRLFLNRIKEVLERERENVIGADMLEIQCPRGTVSKVVGNKKQNKCKISDDYCIKKVKVVEKDDLLGYNIRVIIHKNTDINRKGSQCI